MRWGQLTLVEDDPERYDPSFWLDYFERTKCEAVCLSAGGYIAYYPTDVPLHYRSAWLRDRDSFGELVEGCRAMGMVVIARTDPHAVHRDAYDAHPEWIAVDADGKHREHWALPDVWVTCALGPYNFEFMTEVHRELMARYPLDGIFSNRWQGSGMCYCEHCRDTFGRAYGLELPRTKDPADPARKAYIGWNQERLLELCRLWDGEIRAANPRSRFIPNSGGGSLSELDMSELGKFADTLFADRQGRSGITTPWAAGKNAKEYRAAMGNKPIGGIFSVGLEGKHRWKDSTQSDAEIRIWVADVIANGMRPWFTKFGGVMHDSRWLNVVEDIYTWHDRWAPYLRNVDSLARTAVVYSQQTANYYGGSDAHGKVEDHMLGVYQALIEARIPFDMVHDRRLEPENIDRYRTLLLPNLAALSNQQCDQLRAYVERGGNIVATHETSSCDEWGTPRDELGLADLFGVKSTGPTEYGIKNSYLRVESDTAGRHHRLLTGLENADRIIGGTRQVPVVPVAELDAAPLTIVPAYPDLPMEEVYPRVPRTDQPGAYLRQVGNGRVVYFPWDIDRTFWEVLNPDHGRILANAVEWAGNEPSPVSVIGPGMLDLTIWRQQSSITVHLVNLSNPMAMRGTFRELLAIGEQRVRVRIPAGARVDRVRLLRSGITPHVVAAGTELELTVPSVVDHEVVAIDLR